MALELENQVAGTPQGVEQPSVPDSGSIWDKIPVIDDGDDDQVPAQEAKEQKPGKDAGKQTAETDTEDGEDGEQTGDDKSDESKAIEIQDEAEFKVGDETVNGEQIKELLNLRETYTQQRQADKREVVQAIDRLSGQFSERVDAQAVFTQAVVQELRKVAMGGHTTESLMQLARDNPDTANYLFGLGKQMDDVIASVGKQVDQWRKETGNALESQKTSVSQAKLNDTRNTLAKEPWFNAKFMSQADGYLTKHRADDVAQHIGQSAFLVRTLQKAMAYDEAMARQKAGKQQQQTISSQPSARPADRSAGGRKQLADLYKSASGGSKGARDAFLRAAIPTIN